MNRIMCTTLIVSITSRKSILSPLLPRRLRIAQNAYFAASHTPLRSAFHAGQIPRRPAGVALHGTCIASIRLAANFRRAVSPRTERAVRTCLGVSDLVRFGRGLTGNQKVSYCCVVDLVFRALADPTRRASTRLFARDGQTLVSLTARHDMTRIAVAKHLKILQDAGLVVSRRRGREKLHYLTRSRSGWSTTGGSANTPSRGLPGSSA